MGLPVAMKVRVPKSGLPDAPYPTWRRSVGYHVRGATFRQYRDGCVHIHETPTEWILHRDAVSPHEDLVGHLYHDCRPAFWAYSVLSSATVAAAAAFAARAVRSQFGRSRPSLLKRIAAPAFQWKRPPSGFGRLFS